MRETMRKTASVGMRLSVAAAAAGLGLLVTCTQEAVPTSHGTTCTTSITLQSRRRHRRRHIFRSLLATTLWPCGGRLYFIC